MIARRCRLSFLNAQAALDALPRVVEIMAEELHWSPARAKAETAAATEFLGSMGLPPGAAPRRISNEPKGVVEYVEGVFGLRRGAERRRRAAQEMIYSRAQFEAGEVEALRGVFGARAKEKGANEDTARLETREVYELVKSLPGFEEVRPKDYDYVLEEAGFARRKDVGFDEFVEVRDHFVSWSFGCIAFSRLRVQICAELREVVFAPAPRSTGKTERLRIPVEKSGGGV